MADPGPKWPPYASAIIHTRFGIGRESLGPENPNSETGSLETLPTCGESANHRFLSRGRAGCRPLQSALRLGGRRRNDLPCRVFLTYDECRTIRSNRARRFVSPLRMVSRSAPEENHVRYLRGVSARVNITSNDAIRRRAYMARIPPSTWISEPVM